MESSITREKDQESISNTPKKSKSNWRCYLYMVVFVIKLCLLFRYLNKPANPIIIDPSTIEVPYPYSYEDKEQKFISDYLDYGKRHGIKNPFDYTAKNPFMNKLTNFNSKDDGNYE